MRLLLVLLLFAASVQAEIRDGHWWVRQPEDTKIIYVLGSIDRSMLTGSIDPQVRHDVIGSPEMGEIVAHIDAIYYRKDSRAMLVQQALALALYQIAQSAPK